jgi:hypothetical protein
MPISATFSPLPIAPAPGPEATAPAPRDITATPPSAPPAPEATGGTVRKVPSGGAAQPAPRPGAGVVRPRGQAQLLESLDSPPEPADAPRPDTARADAAACDAYFASRLIQRLQAVGMEMRVPVEPVEAPKAEAAPEPFKQRTDDRTATAILGYRELARAA